MADCDFDVILSRLGVLLTRLPFQLPNPSPSHSQYSSFVNFSLDPDYLEKTGDEVATLGEQLEQVFGWRARTTGDGIIDIEERGEAICALQPLLLGFYKRFPSNSVLQKWIVDILAGVEKVFHRFQVPVCSFINLKLFLQLINIPRFPQCIPHSRTRYRRQKSGRVQIPFCLFHR
jgi:hypothetical protein